MKERTSKVEGLLEKKGMEKGQTYSELFPESPTEIDAYCTKEGIKLETFMQYAWRGRTLSFQGAGETLSDEEKAERKASRKEENDMLKSLRQKAKEQGLSLADVLKRMA